MRQNGKSSVERLTTYGTVWILIKQAKADRKGSKQNHGFTEPFLESEGV
jgi:hypothetical protein